MKLGGQLDIEPEIVNPMFDANWPLFRFIDLYDFWYISIKSFYDFVHKMRAYMFG